MDHKGKSQIFEAFNKVRTNLGFLSVDRELKVILVMSSVKGEGKTTVAVNLADAIAGTEQKVLMMDADLRNPSVHRMFYLPNRKGLSDLICAPPDDKRSPEDAGYLNYYNPYLDILTAGHKPPNPSELLGSKRMKNILESFKTMYDTIVIDTSPFLFISDALALSQYVDGTLLVSRCGYTTREILQNAREELALANIRPLACVLNAVEMPKKYAYYGYSEYVRAQTREEEPDAHGPYTHRQTHRAKA